MTTVVFDMGQTQTRLLTLVDGADPTETVLPGFRYGDDLPATIERVVTITTGNLGVTLVDAVAGGCTGLYGKVPDLAPLADRLRSSLGTRRLVIADDAVTSHVGALGGASGVLVAAGTGLTGLGLGPAGAARVDGVGSLIGDEGSGWWIGRRGAIAALSAHDGRSGGSLALLEALQEKFGPVEDFAATVAGSESPVSTVASVTPTIAEVARAGDPVALSIWNDAARFIGGAVVASARRSGHEDNLTWAVTGRVVGAADLLDAVLHRTVTDAFPDSERVTPHGTALDGSKLLLDSTDLFNLAPLIGAHNYS